MEVSFLPSFLLELFLRKEDAFCVLIVINPLRKCFACSI